MSEAKTMTKAYDDTKRSVREYTDTQRLIIYLVLTFVITFLWFFVANPETVIRCSRNAFSRDMPRSYESDH